MDKGLITVEFYGIPRQRAGRAELTVQASTVREVLAAIICLCPGLKGFVHADGQLATHYRISINGQRFVTDPQERLEPGERVMLLSADVGG